MESIYTELALYGSKNECARTDNVFSPISEVCDDTVSLSQIVNDWRSRAVGGMETALLLWESCCIPSLLNGAGTWTEVTSETEKKLNKTQSWFLRLIFQIGQGAPLASLLWDSGFLDMVFRIKIEKIMLVMHIRSLEN